MFLKLIHWEPWEYEIKSFINIDYWFYEFADWHPFPIGSCETLEIFLIIFIQYHIYIYGTVVCLLAFLS